MVAPSKLQVLKVIADKISLDILNEIGKNAKTSNTIIRTLELTHKQYYSRGNRLLRTGLITRKQEVYSLTSLGKLIYYAQLKIVRAAEYSWKLKVLDAIASNSRISDDEHKSVIDKLIDAPEMKKLILLKLTNTHFFKK